MEEMYQIRIYQQYRHLQKILLPSKYQMIWNQFPKLQQFNQRNFSQIKPMHQQLKTLHHEMIKPQYSISCEYSKPVQEPLVKSNTYRHAEQQNLDEFQKLLRKIEKVKQDYEDDHTYCSKFNLSGLDESIALKRKTRSKPESPDVHMQLKKVKTLKYVEFSLGVDKSSQFEENAQKTTCYSSKISEKTPFQSNNFPLQFQPSHFRTFSATLPSYNNRNGQDFTSKEILSQCDFTFVPPIKQKPIQNKKTITIDLNILDKIPVRKSFNIDFYDVSNLQRNLEFLNLTKKEDLKFSDFHMGSSIGSGKFGEVYLCKHKKTNFICALKKILKSTIEEYNMVEQFIRQLKISYMVDHPNVIKTYGHFHDEFHVFILMQYASDGSAIDDLQKKKGEEFASNVLFQTLNAVDHLHRLRIVHRDIKPENIVVFFKNTYKLCDFGLSAFVQHDMKHTFCGTPDYVSPEMKDVGEYGFSVDMWSLGVLAYELIVGQAPFKEKTCEWKKNGWKKSSQRAWKVEYPKQISAVGKEFMQHLLKEKPEERAKIVSCLRHKFIKGQNIKEQQIILTAQVSGF